jgi:hypothetical protein
MNASINAGDRIARLIEKGEATIRTHKPPAPGVVGFPTLQIQPFSEWRSQSLVFLENLLGIDHTYVKDFMANVTEPYIGCVNSGNGILQAIKEDVELGIVGTPKPTNPLQVLERLCDRFHTVSRQMRVRHAGRPTIDVADEYDVQDVIHSLLWLYFDDVRAEEWTPSYAGKSSRMDFLLKREQVVVEVKKTRTGLGAKEIGSQLIEDIGRYKVHPDCKMLVCFVYDPEGLVGNPRGIEHDLDRLDGPMPVRVFIRP